MPAMLLIDVQLRYARREFVLEATDEGAGLPGTMFATGGRGGRLGLTGMRERAARLGAQPSIMGGADGGTKLALMAPDRAAFAGRSIWPGSG